MYSLIIVFCGMVSSNYPKCYVRSALDFPSHSACTDFMSHGSRRWGEGFVVAYCRKK